MDNLKVFCSLFDREKRSYRGPTSGSYSCDFIKLIDLYGTISIYNDYIMQ